MVLVNEVPDLNGVLGLVPEVSDLENIAIIGIILILSCVIISIVTAYILHVSFEDAPGKKLESMDPENAPWRQYPGTEKYVLPGPYLGREEKAPYWEKNSVKHKPMEPKWVPSGPKPVVFPIKDPGKIK